MSAAELIPCPLCEWTIERPRPQYAPGVAAALGLPTEALGMIHQQQNLRRLESDLEQHLGSHQLAEWVSALTQARAERDAAPAKALREAAAAWDQADEDGSISLFADEHYRAGLNLPSLWLHHRAEAAGR